MFLRNWNHEFESFEYVKSCLQHDVFEIADLDLWFSPVHQLVCDFPSSKSDIHTGLRSADSSHSLFLHVLANGQIFDDDEFPQRVIANIFEFQSIYADGNIRNSESSF